MINPGENVAVKSVDIKLPANDGVEL